MAMNPLKWPVIRHVRYWITIYRINRHYDFYRSFGFLPTHAEQDYAEAEKIWRGER
ncbi:MAG: hypothetical protein LCH39_01955 [Proteobacteria bacterium]|nr:hypothetical protein [Pseudomonadota bacterium]